MDEDVEVWKLLRLLVRSMRQGLKLVMVGLNQADKMIARKIDGKTE